MGTSRKIVANALRSATIGYFLKKGYSCHSELGLNSWGKLRGDVVSVNLKGHIILSEIKSSKADFISDTKWQQYLPYANKVYFILTPKVFTAVKPIILSEIKPYGIGILILDETSGYLKSVVPAKNRLMKKKIKRLLTIRMAWRGGISKRNSRRRREFLTNNV
jgi:hypothetical protein